jgi:hypothetical protein
MKKMNHTIQILVLYLVQFFNLFKQDLMDLTKPKNRKAFLKNKIQDK